MHETQSKARVMRLEKPTGVDVSDGVTGPLISTERMRKKLAVAVAALGVALLLPLFSASVAAAATFTVNETGDEVDSDLTDDRCDSDSTTTGRQCTLRAAIEEANDTAGDDDIGFDLGGTGAQAISPASELPTITGTLTIDGYTQAGASENTLEEGNDAILNIVLGGLDAGAGADGLRIEGSGCTIKGLLIRNFDGSGVRITGSGSTGNRIEGNFIGVNRDGVTDRGNGTGVYVASASNTVGGAQPEERNVISGNDGYGVDISGTEAVENRLEGNYVGTTADGEGDLGNAVRGVNISNANQNTIGGTSVGARNMISGNDREGVVINGFGGDATFNRVEGNYIGTSADGTEALGNAAAGIELSEAASNTVGGLLAGARNVISGNEGDGVAIFGAGATANVLQRNFIGTSANGNDSLSNAEDGVVISDGASRNLVGGTGNGTDSRIAYNGLNGVSIEGSSTGNSIAASSIHSNGRLGINLVGGTEGAGGVTLNDTGDADTGANNLQNFPVIRSATRSNSTGDTTISGRLNSDPGEDFRVQCFLTPNGTPASANGEALRQLDATVVGTNASGSARFSCTSSSPVLGQIPRRVVTATATNLFTGDTSEFSMNKAITTGP
jgi:hypothetical protein